MRQIIRSHIVGKGIDGQGIDTSQKFCEADLCIDRGAWARSELWTSSGREQIAIIPSLFVVVSPSGMSICWYLQIYSSWRGAQFVHLTPGCQIWKILSCRHYCRTIFSLSSCSICHIPVSTNESIRAVSRSLMSGTSYFEASLIGDLNL